MQREQVRHHGIETEPLVSIFQVSDTTYFHVDKVKVSILQWWFKVCPGTHSQYATP